MLQKALGCLFVFGIAPVGIGGLWTKGIGQKREKILNLYLAGFLSELAVFQLIAVPVMVKEVYGMNLLVYLTTAVFAVLAATGFIWTLLRERDLRKQTGRNEDVNQQQAGQAQACSLRKSTISGTGNGARNRIRRTAVQNPERLLFWLLFLASVGYQMYMAFAYASFDGDDAYYVVQSVLADQTGVLNRIRPYTGLSTDLDIRHAAVDCLCGADDRHSCNDYGAYTAAADFYSVDLLCVCSDRQKAVFRWLCKASDFSDAGFHYADLGEYFDLYE